jgi:hypothetical protein
MIPASRCSMRSAQERKAAEAATRYVKTDTAGAEGIDDASAAL